ncbi:hypothetical protein [Candidatus Marinarcus aquaticus]|uniref:DUF3649 domain-containing protein n=1 Tax=Candidatus Marinarcus aquaticus TaxID=2044504 RepID=A0A4Q0XS49_9BACT|nr:hypothetical protein [Candidatus Marinarcus aquaticus]RXJ60320.1 hypothetical protein CRV04_04785 [Candidatus Marinarcus aquaticus]
MTYLKHLKLPEKSGNKIGLFRTLCAVFGGLSVAYLGMTLLIYIIPGTPGESIVIPLLFNTLAWAIAALWIVVAPTRWSALMRSLVPSVLFLMIIIGLVVKG